MITDVIDKKFPPLSSIMNEDGDIATIFFYADSRDKIKDIPIMRLCDLRKNVVTGTVYEWDGKFWVINEICYSTINCIQDVYLKQVILAKTRGINE